MESNQPAPGGEAEAVPTASEVRRREIVLLLILASVQFTSIVDFMVVMPLGPQLERELAIDHGAVRPDRRVVHDRGRAGGDPCLVDHGPVRPQGRLPDALLGLSAGHAVLRVVARVLDAAVCPGNHRRLRGNPGRSGPGDHRRRVSRRAARSRDRSLDVGLRGRLGHRGARRHCTWGEARLARAVPGSGGLGLPRAAGRPSRYAAVARAPSSGDSLSSLAPDPAKRSAIRITCVPSLSPWW